MINVKSIATRKIKRLVLNSLAFGPAAKGFTGRAAKTWERKIYRDLKDNNGYTRKEKLWAYSHGFMPSTVERFGIKHSNVKRFISERDYLYLRPMNGTYNKWLGDMVTIRNIFKPFKEHMPECYYQFTRRDGEMFIIPLNDCPTDGYTLDDVFQLIKDKKELLLTDLRCKNYFVVKYEGNDQYTINGEKLDQKIFRNWFDERKKMYVLMERIKPAKAFAGTKEIRSNYVRLYVFNDGGNTPVIGNAFYVLRDEQRIEAKIDVKTGEFEGGRAYSKEDDIVTSYKKLPSTGEELKGTIPCWDDICQMVDRLCRFVPQIEFMGMDIIITDDGFKITKIVNNPAYPKTYPFDKKIVEFFKVKLKQKKDNYKKGGNVVQRGFKKLKLRVRRKFARLFYPRGLRPYLSITWIRDVFNDLKSNKDATLKEKIWAYRHGFLSYRIPQYGITKQNRKEYISDFEYKWLRHINGKHKEWMEDKITVKYIASKFNHMFPEYYYHISYKNGATRIIPMMDCPKDCGTTFNDIIKLAKEKGELALKPDQGSHGNGFYRLTYKNDKFYMNFQEATEEEIISILADKDNQYLITEYIQMHPDFKKIYSGAVNTIRIIVFKKDGRTPQIGNAYMRFGSKKTGAVDNMGAGGMFAQLDIDTGFYHNAKICVDNSIIDCPRHPDTKTLIEGYIPHWEQVKEDVLKVAAAIPQLEYFGFDLAITEDGIKFPEINRFPDYPKIEKFTPDTIDYLLYKLDKKKKRYGYDNNRSRTLVHLPKR
ncbi:MAG: sugar-transfer associated ATP-grasp domain-containing protein [Lachnospiraceae bacterium]|nr:sugar-transfer associated ATP-grasp domain-containing protein [Lachnospiraceae bacterium]